MPQYEFFSDAGYGEFNPWTLEDDPRSLLAIVPNTDPSVAEADLLNDVDNSLHRNGQVYDDYVTLGSFKHLIDDREVG